MSDRRAAAQGATAPGRAGDHRRRPDRHGPGRRHRHAGHSGRRHEPGQLHLRRPGDQRLRGHGVRLRPCRRAGHRDGPARSPLRAGRPAPRADGCAWSAPPVCCCCWRAGLYGPIGKLFGPPPQYVAGAPFTEQHILSEVLKEKLRSAGFTVNQRQGDGGGRSIPGPARQPDRLLRQLHRQHLGGPDEAEGNRPTRHDRRRAKSAAFCGSATA